MLPFHKRLASRTAHKASYHQLGKPGPGIREVWLCLHGHGQPVATLAARLAHFEAPERLLVFPAALTPAAHPLWYRPASLGPDLALVRAYLDELVANLLVACPAGTALTVLGHGEGATAATTWLAGNRFPYDRLVLDDAVFQAAIQRAALFADLPRSPVLVVAARDPANAGPALLREL